MSSMLLDDTIAAIATAPGTAGLAVVRVSGRGAFACADAVFRGGVTLMRCASHTLHHGWAVAIDHGVERRLDEVVAALFRAPRSYTREDVVELSCHGGRLAASAVLAALYGAGARAARPGEFTQRAFLNGRLDLAQAEAVADLIHAETGAAHALALAQLAGALSTRIAALGERAVDLLAEIEARVDFAEDVGGVEIPPHVIAAIGSLEAEVAALLAGAVWARAVREGVQVPIVGRPNAGKSSLFNALLGEERAIVTELPGTTRDRVSEALEIAGVRVTLSDTAGLRESVEPVESLGIARTRETLASAAVALWVVDGSESLAADDRVVAGALAGKRVVAALNKCDRPVRTAGYQVEALLAQGASRVIPVSATRGDGLESLRAALAAEIGDGGRGDLATAVANPRHVEALERSCGSLARARAGGEAGLPGEIVALELREALEAIGEITGRTVGEDVLERIFSRFCIGK